MRVNVVEVQAAEPTLHEEPTATILVIAGSPINNLVERARDREAKRVVSALMMLPQGVLNSVAGLLALKLAGYLGVRGEDNTK